jgi:hypothetical protein|tara:strand:- start:528 stop:737 length:210 start_codon:yes stop_codon:yes gene_type:complete
MKTFVIIFIVILFILSISYYFGCCQTEDCQSKGKDKRVVGIKRAKKNLHPVINRNVDRDSKGRFVKRVS